MKEAMVNGRRPSAVMMSKRANVFYLERVRVLQKDHRTVYLTQSDDNIGRFINIPDKNTAFILLGKGSSITDAAARKLAESNVLVGFVGTGGSPLISISDITFLVPQDEYRPTPYAQQWYAMWVDESKRLEAAKNLLRFRVAWNEKMFPAFNIHINPAIYRELLHYCDVATNTTQLLTAEGRYAKAMYAYLAQNFNIGKFERLPGKKQSKTTSDKVNAFLDHGNYLAYGYAAVALHGLGIPYFLPLLHGKTRRGALVFDIADLFKDWLIMSQAFLGAANNHDSKNVRERIIHYAFEYRILDTLFHYIKHLPGELGLTLGSDAASTDVDL